MKSWIKERRTGNGLKVHKSWLDAASYTKVVASSNPGLANRFSMPIELEAREEWVHVEARPKTVEELAVVLKESKTVSTQKAITDAFAVPSPVRQTLARDRHKTILVMHPSGQNPDTLVQMFDPRPVEAEIRLLEESIGEGVPNIVHVANSIEPNLDIRADDQIVVITGAVHDFSLRDQLRKVGLCIPHAWDLPNQGAVHSYRHANSVAEAMAYNFPHALEAQCGSWRDWVLEIRGVLPDGTIFKSGSQAVKNVAGYDVHKLFVGARETLGIVTEVVLRVFPIDALPKPEIEVGPAGELFGLWESNRPPIPLRDLNKWIQRTKPSDFRQAVRMAGDHLLSADHASSTLWAVVEPESDLERFGGDWVLRSGCGEKNLQFTDPTQIALMKRAKDLFDPTHKLNPGEMGIF